MKNETSSKKQDHTVYQQALRDLSEKSKPPRILCALMNFLESYRQKRKFGWSRPWNKYGVLNFQSLVIDTDTFSLFVPMVRALYQQEPSMPDSAREFLEVLMCDQKRLMGYIFVSEIIEGDQQYESVTLSFGRKVEENPRFRDRFDLVFDCPIVESKALAMGRWRLIVDPYDKPRKEPLWQGQYTSPFPEQAQQLFDVLCDCSWSWQGNSAKEWNHWTSSYIDYFGDRRIALPSSHFYLSTGKRIASNL